jgi:DoxX-like family
MNVAIWIVQGLLAFAFIAAGAMKLFAYKKPSEKNGQTGITRRLAIFIGITEIAGALGIVLPTADAQPLRFARSRGGGGAAPDFHHQRCRLPGLTTTPPVDSELSRVVLCQNC